MRGVRTAVVLAALLIAVTASPAHAQAPDSPSPDSTTPETAPPGSEVITGPLVSWSIVPATAEGAPAPGVSFRLELEPGATVTEQALLTNHSEETVTFNIAGADGVLSAEGNFDILPPGEESSDIGAWIEIQPSVEVAAGATVLVPFTITVPADATPGDHPGGIVAGVTRATDSADGPRVGFNTRVGVRIHLRVAGEIQPGVTITDLRSTYDASWNPFAPGSVQVSYTLTNTGNVRLGSSQQADIAGLFGLPTGADTGPGGLVGQQREILPGQGATVNTEIEGVWPLGRVSTEVVATQQPVGEDPTFVAVSLASASTTTWAPPWTQLGLVLLVIAAVVVWRKRRAVRRARLEQALAEARAAGAREAATEAMAGDPRPIATPSTDEAVTDEAVANEAVTDDPVPDYTARPLGADAPARPAT